LISSKQCVITDLSNSSALKMDDAQVKSLRLNNMIETRNHICRGFDIFGTLKVSRKRDWSSRRVRILIVVAIIQMRTLKAEEEKGFIGIALNYEWVDPKEFLKKIVTIVFFFLKKLRFFNWKRNEKWNSEREISWNSYTKVRIEISFFFSKKKMKRRW